jgi:hypothetical protein
MERRCPFCEINIHSPKEVLNINHVGYLIDYIKDSLLLCLSLISLPKYVKDSNAGVRHPGDDLLGGSSDFPLSIAAACLNVLKQDHYILEPIRTLV